VRNAAQKPKGAVPDGHHRRPHPAAFQVAQQVGPRLGRLAVAVGDGHQLLGAVGPHAHDGHGAQPDLPAVVTDAIEDHLHRFAEATPDGLLFPSPEGGYLRLENFRRRVWTPAVARAGLAPLRLHDLRHTCASLAIAAGADVKVLQRMLGHASAALTLDRYGHLFPGQAQSVVERLDEMARRAAPAWPEIAVLRSPAGFSRDGASEPPLIHPHKG
jgi:hypothetical protein